MYQASKYRSNSTSVHSSVEEGVARSANPECRVSQDPYPYAIIGEKRWGDATGEQHSVYMKKYGRVPQL